MTTYSAYASWSHQNDPIGPLIAVSAAAFLVFAEFALKYGRWVHFLLLLSVGVTAAGLSGSFVLERQAAANASKVHEVKSANLPREEARKALNTAEAALTAKEREVKEERADGGCKAQCEKLKAEAAVIRQRVAKARAFLVSLGAEAEENPSAALVGDWATTLQLLATLGLPSLLEIAAPIALIFGFGPTPAPRETPPVVELVPTEVEALPKAEEPAELPKPKRERVRLDYNPRRDAKALPAPKKAPAQKAKAPTKKPAPAKLKDALKANAAPKQKKARVRLNDEAPAPKVKRERVRLKDPTHAESQTRH